MFSTVLHFGCKHFIHYNDCVSVPVSQKQKGNTVCYYSYDGFIGIFQGIILQ